MSGGLDRLDLASGKLRVYRSTAGDANTLPADGVMSLYEDRLGTLWVGTFRGGSGQHRSEDRQDHALSVRRSRGARAEQLESQCNRRGLRSVIFGSARPAAD